MIRHVGRYTKFKQSKSNAQKESQVNCKTLIQKVWIHNEGSQECADLTEKLKCHTWIAERNFVWNLGIRLTFKIHKEDKPKNQTLLKHKLRTDKLLAKIA